MFSSASRLSSAQRTDSTAWEIYRDVLDTDVLVNVPIAKHDSRARLSLGGKDLLGVIAGPNGMRRNLGQRAAVVVSLIRPPSPWWTLSAS